MKACPYCAELIQDRALKCRFCGEWLDPSARPAWSGQDAPPAAPEAREPAEPEDRSPAVTATDGSMSRPLRRWSTPPWLADGSTPGFAGSTPPGDAVAMASGGSAGTAVATRPAPTPEPTPLQPAVPLLQPAAAPRIAPVASPPVSFVTPNSASGTINTGRASLEEVALQMERLRQSAEVVRTAIERGPNPHAGPATRPFPTHAQPAPVVHDDLDYDDRDDFAAPPPQPPAVARDHHRADAFDPSMVDTAPEGEPLDPLPAAPRGASRRLEDDFLGDLDHDHDHDHDHDPGESWSGGDSFVGMAPSRRPLPWIPILAGAAFLVVAGAFVFRDALFGTSDATDTAADSGTPEDEAPPAETKAPAEAKTETKQAPEEPAPDAKADDAGTAPAEDTKAAPPTTPAALDAAAQAKLDEARGLYTKAGGTNRKLLKQAGEILDEVLAAAPDHPDALLLKAQVQLESGDMTGSLSTSQRCTQIAPALADCWLTLGILEQENKHKDIALTAYEQYLALAPDGKYAGDVRKQVAKLKR